MPQTGGRVKYVQVNMPWGITLATITSFITSLLTFIVFCGNYPGISSEGSQALFPLVFVYQQVLNMSPRIATLLSVIPCFSAALGYMLMWGCGYQIASMAKSGMIPAIFSWTYSEAEVPYIAFTFSTILQLIFAIFLWEYAPLLPIFQVVVIGASLVYTVTFISFIIFRTRFEKNGSSIYQSNW
jgi:amino acid transporter